ncbi:MAG: 3-phenylpropionate/trans-cinnamate dioxygenase ferredoxin reductase component [Solirubrobacteraceae bacterium]|nr:3-phenylpropionate/trans-cinnamate dioxygenase ferredoxin reductase component [Solirubrobacteraceae bacterium]
MADRRVEQLIIGAGTAGASAARTLRAEGAEQVLLVGRELDAPYHRPPITKGLLQGSETRESAFFEGLEGVELLTRTSVMALDTEARLATLQSKEQIAYGSALIATGAMVRRLDAEGAQLDGIHYLRTLGNAESLRREAEDADRIVCVGGSYIGCEVAASLTTLGKRCTVVMLEAEPLERGFGARAGHWFRGLLEAHGVEIVGEASVSAFTGGERVEHVALDDGRTLPGDVVVVGVGVMPDVMLARKAGLELGDAGGVRCDATLHTSAAGVYAAGDMCEYASPLHDGRHVRIEHEDVAERQGETAARNMLGAAAEHRAVPYFFSDLADWASLEYVGGAAVWDEEIVTGSLDEDRFAVWYLESGRVRAVLDVNGHGDLERGREAIAAGASLSRAEILGGA